MLANELMQYFRNTSITTAVKYDKFTILTEINAQMTGNGFNLQNHI